MATQKCALYRQVAALHIANINRGFISTLGVEFVTLLYRAIDEAAGSVLIVEEADERIIGFVAGGIGMRPIYRQMMRHPIQLLASLLPSIVRPSRVARILETFWNTQNVERRGSFVNAELLSISVDPAYRGGAVAGRLYGRLMEYFASNGVHEFKIIVGDELAPAHRFYRRRGARAVGSIQVHRGENSTIYLQHTDRSAA